LTAATTQLSINEVCCVLGSILYPDLHAKRIESPSDATFDVMHNASFPVAAIGLGLAAARGRSTKHAIRGWIACYPTIASRSMKFLPFRCPTSLTLVP
jgi:hypothetical protein